MAQRFLSIRNLEKYQTNRKENPPWFKIHRVMFGDPEFIKLTPSQRFLYIGLIHLAVESGNKIYNDATFIGQRLYIKHTEVDLKPLYRAGFLYTTNLSRVLSESESESESEESRVEHSCAKVHKPSSPPKSAAVFESYRSAYRSRYGVDPVRNQQTNSMLCKLVDKLGAVEAVYVAEFYLSHNDPFYVRNRHPVNMLLQHAEGLRTQWATGTKATTSEARNAEMKDDINEQVKRVEALLQGRNQ